MEGYSPGIFLERVWKTLKNFSHDNRVPAGIQTGLYTYVSGALPSQPMCSILLLSQYMAARAAKILESDSNPLIPNLTIIRYINKL